MKDKEYYINSIQNVLYSFDTDTIKAFYGVVCEMKERRSLNVQRKSIKHFGKLGKWKDFQTNLWNAHKIVKWSLPEIREAFL